MKKTSRAPALALWLAALPGAAFADPATFAVSALVETEGTSGDVDDPAIWVNPADPAASLILGADKAQGLFVYDLTGVVRQFLPDGRLNNVDLRPFVLNGQQVALAGATRRNDEALVFYVIQDGVVRRAEPWEHAAAPGWMSGMVDDIYGFAMGQDAGGTYALVNYKSGHVLQWRIADRDGQIGLTFMRFWQVATQPEGMMADDRAGHVYVAEEDRGIWRYPLSPVLPAIATPIAMIPSDCLPQDDVEGLAIYDGADQRYLVASAQGIDRAAIYALDGDAVPPCVGLVQIASGDSIDGVSETDGLDVTSQPLGPAFPQGLLVMMDDQNAGFTINFKLIDWAAIAAGLAE